MAMDSVVMGDPSLSDALRSSRLGDPRAFDAVYAAAYDELRRIARGQRRRVPAGLTLTTTALVHEAYLKLLGMSGAPEDRTHFLSIAARAMRHILIDRARERGAEKRGAGRRMTSLDDNAGAVDAFSDELVDIDRALTKLEGVSDRLARIVEWRFFGGMTEEESATALGVTVRTVRRDWQKARAFLFHELKG
jgi:RNA polymerase sigma factor (TIGR02999 family)